MRMTVMPSLQIHKIRFSTSFLPKRVADRQKRWQIRLVYPNLPPLYFTLLQPLNPCLVTDGRFFKKKQKQIPLFCPIPDLSASFSND